MKIQLTQKQPPEEYEADKGYRLLDEDEIKYRTKYCKEIEKWMGGSNWDHYCTGREKFLTYRTKLSREELAKLP